MKPLEMPNAFPNLLISFINFPKAKPPPGSANGWLCATAHSAPGPSGVPRGGSCAVELRGSGVPWKSYGKLISWFHGDIY